MRGVVVVLIALGCSGREGVPCDGVLEPGEICDDGNSDERDGCDCSTRMIPPAPQSLVAGQPSVIVEDGAWCWFQDERVIERDGKLIVASISHGGDIQVTAFDLASGERIHSILHARLERDDHDVASLLPLPDGRLTAFYTRHDGFPHLYSRVADGDFTWAPEHVTTFGYDVTYTNPFLIGDRTYMFMRGIDTNPTVLVSSDAGRDWTTQSQLLDAGERQVTGRVFDHRPYVKYAADGQGGVHMLYTDGHPAEYERNSIYHLVYRDGALYRSDGSLVSDSSQPLLEPNQGTLIYDGTALPGGQAWTWDAATDAAGDPVVVFSTFPDPKRPFYDHKYRYARWNGSQWQVHTVANAGTGIYVIEGFYSGGIALDPDNPNIVYFASNVVPTSGEPTATGIFEIYRGVTTDDGATWTFTPVTSGSQHHNLRPIVPAHHSSPTTVVWLRGSYDTYLDYRTEVVAFTGAADAVATTPATAPTDLVALARFDIASTVTGPPTPTAPGFVAAIPEGGFVEATDRGISLLMANVTGTRESVTGDPLYRGLATCSAGGFDPDDKMRVELTGLTAGAQYIVRVHGHETTDAYIEPTLWFRGDAKTLDSDNNAAFVGAHRNVNTTTAGEGFTDLVMTADASGKIALVARGLDDTGNDRTAVLNGLEVLQPPQLTMLGRFDVATSLVFDDSLEWSGESTKNGITVRVTTDVIESRRHRAVNDPLLADFVYGRDQLVVDVSGLEIGKLYAVTVYSTDTESNQYASSRWRLDEPGHEPLVMHGFHMNLHRTDEGAAFTFYHRASATSFRLRGDDVITSLLANGVVIFNGIDVSVAP